MSPPAPGELGGGVVDWKILGWYWLRGFLYSRAVKMACTSLRVGIEICVYLVLHRGGGIKVFLITLFGFF